ncbi:Mfa1 family fimbria major subunit [Parabacteroides sp. AGMB00274]|uniref:Mfa1 family fimbria major subunit n=1 Tax=Parabacteroides faecalis TaxID=2924040 RepID=A0ABT0C1X9_9BACT|nr:Mfa1 family fimbria major subunit [Parabacteroides faecalis]MCI7285387.1 Mfa1 family fimbria major subunit [Parabacteroides sp.]MCJ2380626.1 Mfa1 family fimbria major subunit [Parabacteroides faecalis]MDD6951730.1 Mfa1 family fimbria major subunit [Parabacteroides sp.]
MMNFKSTLWALAFACVAVSCSDDVEDGLDNNEGNELNGPTTYMKVTISSTPTTKATGGEEGDNPLGEIGDVSEYKVNDVTVILYKNKADGDDVVTSFNKESKLVAAGYKDGIAQMETSNEIWHSRTTATVTITVTDPEQANSFDGKTYGIIAVTNLGGSNVLCDRIKADDINTGAELANFLQVNAWNKTNGFVMSTHNDTYSGPVSIFDKVTLKAGTNATNAPTASVHVERLAAKIRINEADDITDFIYTVNKGEETEAKVRLNQVAIVNKLTSGTYLLKRVTSQLTDGYSDLPADATNDLLLGNELAGNEGIALNYVIDPWTRAKENITPNESNLADRDGLEGANLTSPSTDATLSYDNDFDGENYAKMWNDFSGVVDLSSNNDATFPLHLAYTQENTTSLKMQKNGYSTGALFKATYFPKKWAVTKTIVSGTTIGKVEADDIDYNGDEEGTGYDDIGSSTVVPTDFKFYVYEGNVYKDYEAIFNEFVWTQQEPLDGQADVTIYSYTDFTDTNIENIKVADFFNHLLAEFSDPFGYIDYLKEKYDTDKDGKYDSSDANFAENKLFDANDAIDGNDFLTDERKGKINAVVLPYDGGVCYYPYWIRHASNNIPTKMSVMEFAIVRNNIYDMTVTGISGLGLSGAEKPDPSKDDEEDKYYFNVEIYVKNWVVRSNSGIIL